MTIRVYQYLAKNVSQHYMSFYTPQKKNKMYRISNFTEGNLIKTIEYIFHKFRFKQSLKKQSGTYWWHIYFKHVQ